MAEQYTIKAKVLIPEDVNNNYVFIISSNYPRLNQRQDILDFIKVKFKALSVDDSKSEKIIINTSTYWHEDEIAKDIMNEFKFTFRPLTTTFTITKPFNLNIKPLPPNERSQFIDLIELHGGSIEE